MVKTFCDKCGREIGDDEVFGARVSGLLAPVSVVSQEPVLTVKEYQLCEACAMGLAAGIEGAPDVD